MLKRLRRWWQKPSEPQPEPKTEAKAVGKDELKAGWQEAKDRVVFLLNEEEFGDMPKQIKDEASNKIFDNFNEKYLDPYTRL